MCFVKDIESERILQPIFSAQYDDEAELIIKQVFEV